MGIDGMTGTLEPGKRNRQLRCGTATFSNYALADQVYVDGARLYDRHDPSRRAVSDFMLGPGHHARRCDEPAVSQNGVSLAGCWRWPAHARRTC